VLGAFASGVAVATCAGPDGRLAGMAVNSFASVSLDPPLVLWSIGLGAPSLPLFRGADGFAITVMGAEQKETALGFARPAADKIAGVDWRPGYAGAPVLAGALATLERRVAHRLPGEDHEIVVGRVQTMARREGAPLAFHRGRFAALGDAL
jgi:flavin reductase (DIM6/NTAB) family NADH-FMN oxidoreductase RutF